MIKKYNFFTLSLWCYPLTSNFETFRQRKLWQTLIETPSNTFKMRRKSAVCYAGSLNFQIEHFFQYYNIKWQKINKTAKCLNIFKFSRLVQGVLQILWWNLHYYLFPLNDLYVYLVLWVDLFLLTSVAHSNH